jgi:Family of unknown function (DUF5946)
MKVQQLRHVLNGACPECGRPDCHSIRDELLARDFQQAVYWPYHRMAVDAYCLQHPRGYCESAKSLAAHLCGLCISLEMDKNEATLQGLQRWLSTNRTLSKPNLPDFRGDMTIADAYGIDDPGEYGRAIEAWGRSVWVAYRDLHAVARDWVSQSLSKRGQKQ